MKSILEIFKNDIRVIKEKLKTLAIIIGLIILPSAYAWPNILAAWDPYAHVDQIKVAIVSEDNGYDMQGKNLNIGENLVDNLKSNKALDWVFEKDRHSAEEGVKRGDYYASIVVPEDFTEKITSISRGEPTKANVEYTVNEKINAISPKITNSGASAVVNNINKTFVETANGIIFEKLHEIGISAENNLPQIEKLKETMFHINDNFSDYENILSEVIVKVENGSLLIERANNILPEVDAAASKGILLANKAGFAIDNLQSFNNTLIPTIDKHFNNVENVTDFANETATYIKNNPKDTKSIENKITTLNSRLDSVENRLNNINEILLYINDLSGNNLFSNQIEKIENIRTTNQELISHNNKLLEVLKNYDESRDEHFDRFITITEELNSKVTNFRSSFDNTISPKIDEILKKSEDVSGLAENLFYNLEQEIPNINDKLVSASYKVADVHSKLLNINQKMPEMRSKLSEVVSKIKEVDSKVNLDDLLNLLNTDYKKQSEFFAKPVELKENKLYHIENYGSAMTPFYTALAIWVGSLLMSSLLTTKVVSEKNYRPYEKYLGRGLLFFGISLLQSLIIVLGNIYILGVQTPSKIVFIGYSLIVSLAFCSIVYTIVSVFGNVGKAICIILLVIQMGASGSTFPIQMTSEFFQNLYPKIPFTYAVSLLREAVGGVYLPVASKDIKMLLFYFIIALFIGIVVKLVAEKLPEKPEDTKPNIFL
ncbi:YhgE/Pip domain-containing protein [Gemelliphila palaticanis]|uniref:YhgE/Pip domain-containing protein n=1 Tax=Gemelliphila palaticanis TaxID=81950 RepID=A0ABX2T356_9BACL|nr:YhgE/Pip domain-containing protein [Gemella palaticanis]MBF0715526.1 YhgE/Pip domain-containing protein [Gemella palaticanis]NYS47456.1 YhgE/Pip domain-containing protein [Gemella palaticanis]